MTVHYEVSEGTATITLDAPERRNALSGEMIAAIRENLAKAAADAGVRSVVISHTGTVFCSGMDLKAAAAASADVEHPVISFPRMLTDLWDFPKPVIARVAGKARAGGLGLVAACDISVAATTSDFAFTEVRIGVVAAMISVPILARANVRIAEELFLTGETFDAARAREMGLINSISDDVDAEVARYTAMFALCEPKALAGTKKMVRRDRSAVSMAEDYEQMAKLSASFFASPEAAEGMAAFAAKRAPRWAEVL